MLRPIRSSRFAHRDLEIGVVHPDDGEREIQQHIGVGRSAEQRFEIDRLQAFKLGSSPPPGWCRTELVRYLGSFRSSAIGCARYVPTCDRRDTFRSEAPIGKPPDRRGGAISPRMRSASWTPPAGPARAPPRPCRRKPAPHPCAGACGSSACRKCAPPRRPPRNPGQAPPSGPRS